MALLLRGSCHRLSATCLQRLQPCSVRLLLVCSVREGAARFNDSGVLFASLFEHQLLKSSLMQQRYQSTVKQDSHVDDKKEKKEIIVLFERHPDSGGILMQQSSIILSTFHTMYWIWYNVDFIPTVNQTAMTALHIDPVYGIAGFIFGVVVQVICYMFPRNLISKLEVDFQRKEMLLYNHDIPWVRPGSTPASVLPIGKMSFNPESPEVKAIMNNLHGDFSKFRGYINVITQPRRRPAYVLEVQSELDVPEPDLLFDLMVYPDLVLSQQKQQQQQQQQQQKPPKTTRRKVLAGKPVEKQSSGTSARKVRRR